VPQNLPTNSRKYNAIEPRNLDLTFEFCGQFPLTQALTIAPQRPYIDVSGSAITELWFRQALTFVFKIHRGRKLQTRPGHLPKKVTSAEIVGRRMGSVNLETYKQGSEEQQRNPNPNQTKVQAKPIPYCPG
jgi:hypothetical protein